MLTRLDVRGVAGRDLRSRLPRPQVAGDEPTETVRAIVADVRARGDAAVRDCTERFDGVVVDDLQVAPEELKRALDRVEPDVRLALEEAARSIEEFHRAVDHLGDSSACGAGARQVVRDGLVVRAWRRPVDRAGCYVPGGRARYPSTVLMTAIPARVAGVGEVAVCVPPGPDGRVADVVLAAASVAGVDEVYAVGGAQAVAALAYGTESVPAVDVIVGPGNVYVALAKREVAGVVGVPAAFAGPSEVVVVADDTTPVELAAIDLVVQAEHGPHGLAWLVTWSGATADAVTAEVTRQAAAAPRRADIEATLGQGGYAVVVDGPEQALAVANHIAPEHLQLMSDDPEALVPLVRHAGAVFCGALAPASVGDYLAGPSHVLPTFGSARFAGALNVDDFVKDIHVVSLDAAAFERVAPHVEALARAEGLDAHASSIHLRRGGLRRGR